MVTVLSKFPLPLPNKTGWPWTEESPSLPNTMPNGKSWPRISIVTPSYNQGQFLEETIRSVLFQNYPDLEYIIIDGGSTDNSLEIIKKYEPWLTYWISETDRGQSHALNKGFKQVTGDIVGWLNSDDLYFPGTFKKVAQLMWNGERVFRPLIYSSVNIFDTFLNNIIQKLVAQPADFDKLLALWEGGGLIVPQQGVFIKKELSKEHRLNENLNYVMDYDLWLRLSLEIPFYCLSEETFAAFRFHNQSKTLSSGKTWPITKELIKISHNYWGRGRLSYIECFTKFWYQYVANRYLIWPMMSLLRQNKNRLVGDFIKVVGQNRYKRIKKIFKISNDH